MSSLQMMSASVISSTSPCRNEQERERWDKDELTSNEKTSLNERREELRRTLSPKHCANLQPASSAEVTVGVAMS